MDTLGQLVLIQIDTNFEDYMITIKYPKKGVSCLHISLHWINRFTILGPEDEKLN